MGLLDLFDPQDPRQAGLLNAAFSLLGQQGFGNAGLAGINAAQNFRQQQALKQRQELQNKLLNFQLGDQQRQAEIADLPGQFVQRPTLPGTMDNRDVGLPGEQPLRNGFDQEGYIQALMGKSPLQAEQYKQAVRKDTTPIKVGQGEALLEPGTYKPIFTNPKTNDLPSAIQEYNLAKQQGYGGTFTEWDKERKRAGAASTSVKIDNQLGGGLAKEVGPMLKESFDAARGAQQQLGTADNLVKAVDSGKVLTGPGATFRLRGLQIGQTLGLTGADSAETIANTRAAIQGLAQSTVAARSALKGQGQVSDFEGRLLEKAASGNVDDMTAGEIKQIALVNKRLAAQQINSHKQMVNRLRGHDSTAPIADMFDLTDIQSGQPYAPVGGGGWSAKPVP